MFNNVSINRDSFKAVGIGIRGGGLKFDRNDLTPAVLKIWAFLRLLWGIKSSKYCISTFFYDFLNVDFFFHLPI